jgi:farnesyl diphosphate synthase
MNSPSSLSILNSYYDTIIEDLVSNYSTESSKNLYLQKILSHFKTVLDYNISDGKKLRGTTVIDTVRMITSGSNDELLLKQAAIVGWCIELMQGSFLVADDLMDHSITRRGKPCWYLNIKEKEWAVNDAYYLLSCTLTLLNKYFPTNFKLSHLFHEVYQRTVIGQGLDTETPSYLPSIDLYTEEHYYTVVTWKTAYYTIVLPIISGLLISPLSSLADHPELKSIGISIGIYFQVQDDYLDCYGDAKQTGKLGTDIQERKCSWLIVQAVKLLKDNDQKRQILCDNYGFDDPNKIQCVKDIYQELNLKQVYQDYEQTTYDSLSKRIEQANFNSKELEKLLKQILDTIYARSK